MSSESILKSLQNPTHRRLWLLNRGLEILTLSGALQLAQEAEEFLSGAELGEESATSAEAGHVRSAR